MKVIDIGDYSLGNFIDVDKLTSDDKKLQNGLIEPAKEDMSRDLVNEHDAEPIKSLEDIDRISDYLISNGRFRDNMLFISGINFGLRMGDLLSMRFADIINDNYTFKSTFAILEQKTKNTRKRKRNRYVTINKAVRDAVTLYLRNKPGVSLSDYMFRSVALRNKNVNEPLTVRAVNYILKGIANELSLNIRVSTHTLRKTFCYHQMVMSNNSSRKLLLLQKMLGHSSPVQTLTYIGITSEEIEEAYKNLNLGSRQHNYMMQSDIILKDEVV